MSVRITDGGVTFSVNGFNDTTITNIDRAIYNRLQMAEVVPLGSHSKDLIPPISTYIARMEIINGSATSASATAVDLLADDFFGSLGKTQYYPHPDNKYKGELQ